MIVCVCECFLAWASVHHGKHIRIQYVYITSVSIYEAFMLYLYVYKYTFLLCVITIFSLMRPFKLTLFIAMYYIFLAIVVYSYSNVTFGSLWCWISSFLSVFVYFISKLIK